ncbi:MAG: hypothetical protein DHS20C17_11120 [Cyclobacteriaceae bacterium]|nr:MAG: hypothetical protein DHS20C17_11120 [Cyclobacteriaceae bacterium]
MIWSIVPVHAQDPSVNTLDLYRTGAPVNCTFTAIDRNDSLLVYALVEFTESISESVWISHSWFLSGKEVLDSVMVSTNSRSKVIQWSFSQDQVPALITLSLDWKARSWTYQEHFPMNAFHTSGGVWLWRSGLPQMKPWINLGDSIQVVAPDRENIYVYYYGHPFEPARPPMTVNPGKNSGSLSIDSILILKPGTHYKPASIGLYFFQGDSTTTEGTSLVVADESFPQPRKISDLTEPLIYITTRNEFRKLKEDLSNKQAFDKFWLSTLGSADKAREAIRRFYQNAEETNVLFTSYKEGWKTDRGMIYTVIGPPLSIVKDHDTETWIYRGLSGDDELSFVFKKVRNIFSNNHYELFRNKAYDRTWFLAIDRWRKGQIR